MKTPPSCRYAAWADARAVRRVAAVFSPEPALQPPQALRKLELVLTALFTCEAILKSVANGLIMREGAYLRNAYNVIDFVVVVSSLVNVALSNKDFAAVRVLRLMRCLRPLRLISRNQVSTV